MNSQWSSLRDSVKPSASFRERLKADILETVFEKEQMLLESIAQKISIPPPKQTLVIQKKIAPKESQMNEYKKKWKSFVSESLLRWGMLIGGTAFASIALFPILIPYFSPPTQAINESIIRNIEGSVALTRNGNTILASNSGNILDNDVLMTGENATAEIIFFDGSIIRVAPHSTLIFNEITPHPFLVSSGGISVSLENGEIWMKTFSLSSENSQISVQTADLKVVPSRAAFLLRYSDGIDHLQVWENSATVMITGLNIEDSLLVKENESLQFSPFDKALPSVDYLMEKTEFVNSNLKKDVAYTKEFLERVTAQMKEEYILSSLSSQIHTFLENNSDPESVEYLISELNNLILVSRKQEIIPETREEEASDEKEEKKYLPLKKNITNTKNPNTQNLSSEKNTSSSNQSQVFPVDTLTDTPKTASELAKAHQEFQKNTYQEKVSQSFVEQVNQFSFSSSRETKAKTLLNNIPNTEDSVSLLKKIETSAPEDIKEQVIKKREEIEKKVFKNAPPSPSPLPTVSSLEEENKEAL